MKVCVGQGVGCVVWGSVYRAYGSREVASAYITYSWHMVILGGVLVLRMVFLEDRCLLLS